MPIRSDFPSFIMAFVIFLSGCCFICHEMEPRSVVNFMDALNKFTSGEVHLIRGKVVHFPPEKKRNGDKINIFGGKVHQKSGKMVHFPPKLSAGPKTCPAPETGTGTERERWKDAAPGSGECMRMAERGWRIRSRTAAAYSPALTGSTIGDGGLNFSVRDGKRWDPASIAAFIRHGGTVHRCPRVCGRKETLRGAGTKLTGN